MTAADGTGPGAPAARLRALLAELEDAPTEPPRTPDSQHQLEVCAEIEAIVEARVDPITG